MPPVKQRKPLELEILAGDSAETNGNSNGKVESSPLPKGVRVAINLKDLDRIVPAMRQSLLTGKLALAEGAIRTDPARADEAAVAFCCDALTAALVCDIVRSHDRRAGDAPTRCYLFRKAWSKVPGTVALSVVEDGQAKLNPALFGERIEAEEPTPLETPLVSVGKPRKAAMIGE